MELFPDRIEILVLDEDRQVVETIQSCFPAPQYHCVTATRATVALDLLKEFQFHVVLCAMHLPGLTGLEVLRQGLARNPHTTFLMLTNPPDWESMVEAMKIGAYDCIEKPFECDELITHVERALQEQRSNIEQEICHALVEQTLRERTEHLHRALQRVGQNQQSALERLVAALDTREQQTNLHSLRVQKFSLLLAQKCGYSGDKIKQLGYGALLHDIGKIAIPDSILLKPSKLTLEEFQIMQHHSMFGYRVLARIPHLQQASLVALFHHERFDGGGYPYHLRGSSIPIEARIFAVADTLDVITAGRPYCPARSMEDARAEIRRCSGTQFDRDVVDVFMGISDEEWSGARENVSTRYENVFSSTPIQAAIQSAAI